MSTDEPGNVSAYSPEQLQDSRQAASQLGRGAVWMVAMRWAIRLVGVVSTIILARLLVPQDFGVMAIAMLVVAFVEVLGESGQHGAIIRHAEDTPDLYNAAWTLSVLQGIALAMLIAATAPLAVVMFDEPKAQPVILFLALRPLLLGFANIGVVAYLKELNFRREFQFRVLEKAVTFIVTITLAFTLRSYWALAIGIVTGAVVQLILSYWLHPFRPRLSLGRLRELLSYSLHVLAQSIMWFGWRKADEFVVAGLSGTGAVGNYAVAGNLATAPIEELVLPAVRALHPVYSRLAGKMQVLRETYLLVFGAVATIVLPASVGFALIAADLVPVVLGDKWSDAIPIIRWLALAIGLTMIAHSSEALLNATGSERRTTQLGWLRLMLLAPAVAAAGWLGEVETVALSRFLVAAVVLPAFLLAAARRTHCVLGDYGAALWRPLLATAAMALALFYADGLLQVSAGLRLMCLVALGAAVYTVALYAGWFIAGRRPGPERLATDFVLGRLRRLRSTAARRADNDQSRQ